MTRAVRLRQEAKTAATWRGHDMGRFVCVEHYCRVPCAWRSTCRKCGMSVDASTHPAPNGIDIGGEAVALGCEDE